MGTADYSYNTMLNIFKRKSAKQPVSSLSSRETQQAYQEEFKKQPDVNFPENKISDKKVKPSTQGSSSVPTPAARKSKIVNKPDLEKKKSETVNHKSDQTYNKAQENLDIRAKKAQEFELIEAIKDVFDKDGTGLVDAQQLRMLLGSLGNKLGKHEMGVISQFENKEGKVLYEKLV